MKLTRSQVKALKTLNKALVEAQEQFFDIDCVIYFDEVGNGATFDGSTLENFDSVEEPQ